MQPRVEQEKELVKWTAASRPFKPLSRQIFTTAVAIAILVGVILIFAGEWVLIMVMAAAIFAYYAWSTVPPEESEYVITTRGLRVHGQLYRWEELSRWWMEDKWGYKLMVVDTPLSFPRRLHVVLGTASEAKVKEVMEKYVLMERPEPTAMDRAGKWVAEKFPLEAGR